MVMREILARKQADDRLVVQLGKVGEQRGIAGDPTSVIFDALARLGQGLTGRGRVDQHQYIAVFDHGAEVVREHELPVDVVVRLDKIDGFAGIQAADTRGGKLAAR